MKAGLSGYQLPGNAIDGSWGRFNDHQSHGVVGHYYSPVYWSCWQ